jgi:hypothetical protein
MNLKDRRMNKIGELYTLKREVDTTGYNFCDHYNTKLRKKSELIPTAKFEQPFIFLGHHNDDWIHILVEDKVGWINASPEQLKKFIYR